MPRADLSAMGVEMRVSNLTLVPDELVLLRDM